VPAQRRGYRSRRQPDRSTAANRRTGTRDFPSRLPGSPRRSDTAPASSRRTPAPSPRRASKSRSKSPSGWTPPPGMWGRIETVGRYEPRDAALRTIRAALRQPIVSWTSWSKTSGRGDVETRRRCRGAPSHDREAAVQSLRTPAEDRPAAVGGVCSARASFLRDEERSGETPEGLGTVASARSGTGDVGGESTSPDGECPHCGLELPDSGPPLSAPWSVSPSFWPA
jgi:hypothetical protein